MGRRVIEIERIDKAPKRMATFKKRKNGLIKKAMELSILTGCKITLTLNFEGTEELYGSSLDVFKEVCCGVSPAGVKTDEDYHHLFPKPGTKRRNSPEPAKPRAADPESPRGKKRTKQNPTYVHRNVSKKPASLDQTHSVDLDQKRRQKEKVKRKIQSLQLQHIPKAPYDASLNSSLGDDTSDPSPPMMSSGSSPATPNPALLFSASPTKDIVLGPKSPTVPLHSPLWFPKSALSLEAPSGSTPDWPFPSPLTPTGMFGFGGHSPTSTQGYPFGFFHSPRMSEHKKHLFDVQS